LQEKLHVKKKEIVI